MSRVPAYIRVRQRERSAQLKKFLLEMVISDEFDLDDLCLIQSYMSDAESEIQGFCEWFGLGDWFIDEMKQDEFNIDDFMLDAQNLVEKRNRDATEYVTEVEQSYKEVAGFGGVG